jgi:hypothetical protein
MMPVEILALAVTQTEPVAAVVSAAPDSVGVGVTVLQAVLGALGSVLTVLLPLLGRRLLSYIAAKTENQFLVEFGQKALVVALHYYQTEVRHLKQTSRWTPKARADILRRAAGALGMMSDPKKLREAAGEMGVERFLEQHVEAAVHQAKTAGKAAAAGFPRSTPPDPSRASIPPSPT